MADLSDLRAEIVAVDAKIKGVESKEGRLEAALEGNGSCLGTTDHGELRGFHERLMKEKEQLRKEKEQLREKELVLLRQQKAVTPGPAGSSSISDRDRSNKYRRSLDIDEGAVAGAAAGGELSAGTNGRSARGPRMDEAPLPS